MLHERLRRARETAELSQRELSRLAGLSEGTVWFIECRPDKETAQSFVVALADVLGVSLDWLVRGLGDEPTAEQIRAAVAVARERAAGPTEAA